MKKLLVLLPVLALLMAACSNEFEVTAPWKEIPIVFAILSPKDTAHYVRVEKAFLDPEKSALEIAQIADSLYYPESAITVWLERPSTQTRVPLTRVDGALEGYPRENGIFATQPNWLYKFKPQSAVSNLIPGELYRLVIVRADDRPDVTAETKIPGDFLFVRPIPAQSPPLISFIPSDLTEVEWRCDANSVLFSIIFKIRYREENANGSLIARDTLVWNAHATFEIEALGAGSANFRGLAKIASTDFYRFLKTNIDSVAVPPFRYFEGMDITVIGGGKEIKAYQTTASANLGLTGAEVLPNYTNLSEGFGIFSSKNSTNLNNVKITSGTVDSMSNHALTRHLNFRL